MQHGRPAITTTFINLDAAAVRLGLPNRFVREQAERGAIPTIRVGRRTLTHWERCRDALSRRLMDDDTGHDAPGSDQYGWSEE